jgi:CubicO group peptidase (beta-lactamase class C family)
VRRYVPELRLTDDRAAAQVTVLQLLNHSAGLDWGLIADVGEGDDALAGYGARMAELDLIGPPGARTSYSQAGDNLAGRIIEQVTGLTSERAVASLVLEPVGLQHSFLAATTS